MKSKILAPGLVLALLAAAGPAAAQDPATAPPAGPDAEAAYLVRQAMQAYETNLDVEGALAGLERAIEVVRQNGLTGPWAALAYGLRGVIHVWYGEPDPALERMRQAIGCDPAFDLPVGWAGRDTTPVLEQARTQGPLAPPPPVRPPAFRHTPPAEQLWNHPVPIYTEVNPALGIAGVTLFFRARGETTFQQLRMGRTGAGYYVELPCTMVQPRAWEYYLAAVDDAGTVVDTDGTPEAPHEIAMTESLAGAAPTRPNGALVPSCRADGGNPEGGLDCPPGITCGGVQCRSCAFNADCLDGEVCTDFCCGPSPETLAAGGPIGLWVDLSVGFGFGIIGTNAKEPLWYYETLTGEWLYGPDAERDLDAVGPGIAIGGAAVRLGIGYQILPELSVAINGRIAFPFDEDFPWLVEGRVAWWFLTGPQHYVSAFLGGGGGVVVHLVPKAVFNQGRTFPGGQPCGGSSPVAECRVYEPFYKASGFGSVALGGQYLYHLYDWLGLGGELAMNVMVPEFSYNFDLLFDVRFAF